MHLMFHIVYAAHASGTHHKLALDARRHLECTDADLWQRLFLTPAGQRVLRQGGAPDIARIEGWLAAARRMQAA